jgi:hypothetical protein
MAIKRFVFIASSSLAVEAVVVSTQCRSHYGVMGRHAVVLGEYLQGL